MGTDEGVRAGTLVLRAWVEPYDGGSLRVRITRTIHGRTAGPVTSVSADADEVCEIVRSWLEEL